MSEPLNSEATVRAYLLGRISDEKTLEAIEELLFGDREFCSLVELAEEDLINDYVMGRLSGDDAASFRSTFPGNRDRQFKVKLTEGLKLRAQSGQSQQTERGPSFFASILSYFRKPLYAAALITLLVAVLIAVFFFNRPTPAPSDELASLRAMYEKSRPTQSRISQFVYAPQTQLRGEPDSREQTRLRVIENKLSEANEQSASAQTHYGLGVFYITQQKYPEAIQQLEAALKFSDRDARTHNELGVAYFELAKIVDRDRRFEELSRSLDQFNKAIALDANLLEALFNRALALQELDSTRQAKDAWKLYLQKDNSSPWANEARKNLEQLESQPSSFKDDDEVLDDFLTAFRNQNFTSAQKIHNETKGTLGRATVSQQLARRYLKTTNEKLHAGAAECLAALKYVGDLERNQSGDSFFFELANFYTNAAAGKLTQLQDAHELLQSGYEIMARNPSQAIARFELSRDRFTRAGDLCEAAIAESWAIQFLPDIARITESRERLSRLIANAEARGFVILLPTAYYSRGMGHYDQGNFFESATDLKTALQWAERGNNTFEIQRTQHALAVHYSELGELEPALTYASKLPKTRDLYFQTKAQDWRIKGVLLDLALKLKLLSTAQDFGQERLSMAREWWPNDRRINDSLRSLIEIATAREDFPAALQYCGESIQFALAGSSSTDNTRRLAEVYYLQANAKRQSKNYLDAIADYDKALELNQQFPEVTESLYQVHKGKLSCYQQLNWQDKFAEELRVVFKFAELYRATIREDSSRQAFFASEQDVYDAATNNLLQLNDPQGAFVLTETSRARSLLDFVASGKSITEIEKHFGPVARPLSLVQIQSRLPEQVQLVQYAVLPERLAVWILSKDNLKFSEQRITASELKRKIETYQESIVDQEPLAKTRQAGAELYELLIPKELAAGKQLCIVPDKFLHQLSFASLVAANGSYLLQSHALSYAPSASIFVLASEQARQRQDDEEKLLSIGNPAFERSENRGLPDLRDSETEARAISSEYQKSQTLIGSDATRSAFIKDFPRVAVIHFAGHFVANRRSPANSKLLLAAGELRSSELGAYKLPLAKLVVLSACETGVESYSESEGAIGIARTWLGLGAPIVVASQWKVDSGPTKDLMIEFHHNRKSLHMNTAESLRQAQLQMLGRDETKAPFYWAAFAPFGGYTNY